MFYWKKREVMREMRRARCDLYFEVNNFYAVLVVYENIFSSTHISLAHCRIKAMLTSRIIFSARISHCVCTRKHLWFKDRPNSRLKSHFSHVRVSPFQYKIFLRHFYVQSIDQFLKSKVDNSKNYRQ